MNLIELKNKIDHILTMHPDYADHIVVVTTSDSSVGGRAYSEIRSIYNGFDWEQNQVRIDVVDKLKKS